MKIRTALLSISIPALLVVGGAAFALQDKDKGHAAAGAQGDNMMPEMPKPTKEHQMLKSRIGTWDAAVSCPMMGNSTGTETNEAFGDFWIVSRFTGEMMGMPFKGMSLVGYDPIEQKYVSTWCDTMSPALMVMKGTMEGRKLTSTGKGPDMMGNVVEWTNVLELKDADHASFTMYETAKGADSPETMHIEYTRRK